MNSKDLMLILFSALMTLSVALVNAQPQSNICDSVCFADKQYNPATPSISFDFATKILSISSVDTPCGYDVKRFYAWKLTGNNGYAFTPLIWGGLICNNYFYDYYLSNTQSGLDAETKYYLIAQEVAVEKDLNGVKRGYVFYEVRARNAFGYYSQPIRTNYLQP